MYHWFGNLLHLCRFKSPPEMEESSGKVNNSPRVNAGIRPLLSEPIKNLNKIHICNHITDDDAGRQDTPYASVMLEIGDDVIYSTEIELLQNKGENEMEESDGCNEAEEEEKEKVEEEKVEKEKVEEILCCICLCDVTEPDVYISKCNHSTCVDCILKLYELKRQSIQCPLCRSSLIDDTFCTFIQNCQKQKKLGHLPPFDLTRYPVEVDWSFIRDRHLRMMVKTAYEAVHYLKKWEFLYYFELGEGTGFMFCQDPEIEVITDTVERFYTGGHSGSSMGGTMRHIQFIAKHGLEEYSQMLLLDRN